MTEEKKEQKQRRSLGCPTCYGAKGWPDAFTGEWVRCRDCQERGWIWGYELERFEEKKNG